MAKPKTFDVQFRKLADGLNTNTAVFVAVIDDKVCIAHSNLTPIQLVGLLEVAKMRAVHLKEDPDDKK